MFYKFILSLSFVALSIWTVSATSPTQEILISSSLQINDINPQSSKVRLRILDNGSPVSGCFVQIGYKENMIGSGTTDFNGYVDIYTDGLRGRSVDVYGKKGGSTWKLEGIVKLDGNNFSEVDPTKEMEKSKQRMAKSRKDMESRMNNSGFGNNNNSGNGSIGNGNIGNGNSGNSQTDMDRRMEEMQRKMDKKKAEMDKKMEEMKKKFDTKGGF